MNISNKSVFDHGANRGIGGPFSMSASTRAKKVYAGNARRSKHPENA